MMNLMEDAHTITLTPNQRNHNESGMDKFESNVLASLASDTHVARLQVRACEHHCFLA